MSDIQQWLSECGLGQYAAVFADNDIDLDVLPNLSDQDLQHLGLSLGHRRKLLTRIKAGIGDDNEALAPIDIADKTAETGVERRHLTVMFCDLVGSTAIAETLDPEDMRDLIRTYQDAVGAEIVSLEGYVAKFMGDGVLAYFGWPQAHEDDAERAARSGLAIAAAVGRLALPDGTPLQVRIGIATGLVVVGDLIGEIGGEEEAVVGGTPNLAARLQGVAAPDQIVIGPTTRALLGGNFVYADLGPHNLKGFAEPVEAWHVVRALDVDSRFEAQRTVGLTPMMGRGEELDLFERRWDQSQNGEGQVVLLSGEPGIGKSRVAHACYEHVARQPHIRLLYQCSPHHVNSALYPFIRQIEHFAGVAHEESDEQKLNKLEAVLMGTRQQIEQAAALIAPLLSIPTGKRYAPLNLSPQVQKERTMAELLDQMERFAERLPVLLVFEDAHWIDPTSQEALDLVIDRAQRHRVTVIVTYRPEYSAPWTGQPHVSLMALKRLTREHRTVMARDVSGGKDLPEEVLEQIVEKTDGVPLFIEELTKTVLASGLLKNENGRYVLEGALPALAIPTTLQDSLMARLDKLARVKEIAQMAAVIGREFSYKLLALVTDLTEQALADALEQLTQSELVFATGSPPQASYIFKHALVQDAAYESLLKSRRRQIHTRIVEVLETHSPDRIQVEPEILAHHCTHAGLTNKAIAYWRCAGSRAVGRSDHQEAVGHLSKGLELLEDLPAGFERDSHELDIQSSLGPPLIATKGYGSVEAGNAYRRARKLWSSVGGDSARLCPILYGLWANSATQAAHRQARDIGRELLNAAQSVDDTASILDARLTNTCTEFLMGEFEPSKEHGDRAIELYDPQLHAHHPLQNPRVCSGVISGLALWMLGYPDQALERAAETVKVARDVAHPFSLAVGLTWFCLLRYCRREARETQDVAEETIALCKEKGFPYWEYVAAVVRGWALSEQSQDGEGIALVREGVALLDATGAKIWRPFQLSLLADAQAKAGQLSEAQEGLGEALRIAHQNAEHYWEAELHRMRGELYRAQSVDHWADSETCFHEALNVARGQNAKSLELRAALSLARLWRDQERRREAHDLLAPIYDWFTEGFDTADLVEAKAVLVELGE
jgi:class 3 adenylate cyclase/predicted ATPase